MLKQILFAKVNYKRVREIYFIEEFLFEKDYKKRMINVKSSLMKMMLVLMLAQCNNQTKKTNNMETTYKTKSGIKEIIVDVRSIEEWNTEGHADCSVNYPLDQFSDKIEELKTYDKVILVCRSGNRAGIAKGQLQSAGYTKVIENLGSWENLVCKY